MYVKIKEEKCAQPFVFQHVTFPEAKTAQYDVCKILVFGFSHQAILKSW